MAVIEMKEETKVAEPEQKKKVISGKAKVKTRTSLAKKLRDTFVPGDVISVKRYVIDEVVVPGIKNLIVDTIGMFILGDNYSGRGRSYSSIGRRDRTSYSVRYDSDKGPKYASVRTGGKYRDIIYETREDAEDVLEELDILIKEYGSASISDLYSASGITPDYTDEKCGWVDLKRATIRRVSDGYILDMPKAYPLD